MMLVPIRVRAGLEFGCAGGVGRRDKSAHTFADGGTERDVLLGSSGDLLGSHVG